MAARSDGKTMTVEWVQECKPCQGTGLYVGVAERDGAAVVCHTCDGTGRREMKEVYQEFTGLKHRDGVRQVYATSSGICSAPDVVPGGVPYSQWLHDPTSVSRRGAEMREHTCPAWWYQNANYDLKPNWSECAFAGRFSSCAHFPDKAKCWERFDREREAAS